MKAHSQGGMVGLNMTVFNLSLIRKLVLKRTAHEIKPVLHFFPTVLIRLNLKPCFKIHVLQCCEDEQFKAVSGGRDLLFGNQLAPPCQD